MLNELIFLSYICVVSGASLIALALGKEALIALICLQAVLVNFFVTKQITLFGLTATASDALAVGTTLALNLLARILPQTSCPQSHLAQLFTAPFFIRS